MSYTHRLPGIAGRRALHQLVPVGKTGADRGQDALSKLKAGVPAVLSIQYVVSANVTRQPSEINLLTPAGNPHCSKPLTRS